MNNFPQDAAPGIEPSDQRLAALADWLRDDVAIACESIVPASGDASFRRYFRVYSGADSLIAMDAPPPLEDVKPFLDVARLLACAGVTVPRIHAADTERGFVLLEDLGTLRYGDELQSDNADRLYRDAIDALLAFQRDIDVETCGRPPYDEALLRRELGLFQDWFLARRCGIVPDTRLTALYDSVAAALVESALEQPTVFVHRDYHSRNLMVCGKGNPGILDFQDAVIGPITYDLVSLLRDCYISWPEHEVERWLHYYAAEARKQGLAIPADPERLRRWFDLMGMQRHLKAVGIFSRLSLRDGKHAYLTEIPRTLGYVKAVCARYPDFANFRDFLDHEVGALSVDRAAA